MLPQVLVPGSPVTRLDLILTTKAVECRLSYVHPPKNKKKKLFRNICGTAEIRKCLPIEDFLQGIEDNITWKGL